MNIKLKSGILNSFQNSENPISESGRVINSGNLYPKSGKFTHSGNAYPESGSIFKVLENHMSAQADRFLTDFADIPRVDGCGLCDCIMLMQYFAPFPRHSL
jgi:hypothetical protein